MIVFEKEGVQHHVEFPNRCFFCFVKVTSAFDGVSFDTSAQVQFPAPWFQQVFNHLVPSSDKNSIDFGRLPPICADCGTLLEVLHAALTHLASVTIEVKSRISNFGTDAINKEQRLHDFFGDWRNISRGSGSYQEALNILKKIGHGPFPRWMNWFQEHTSPGNCTDAREDGEVLEWNQDEFQSEAKPGGSHEEILEIEKMDKEEPEFVENLEKKEPGFENNMEVDFGSEDEEFFDDEEDVNMEEEPIQASRLESHEQDPLTDSPSLHKVFVSEEKLVGGSKTVKTLLLQGISKPQESTRLCDFCREPVIVRQLLNHVRGHVGDYAKACPNPTCTHVYALFTSLRSHTRDSKSCRGLFKEDITTCEICGHRSKTKKSLLTHLKTTHNEAARPYSCPVSDCFQKFPVRQAVNYHLASHVVPKERKISPVSSQPCPDCGKEYHPEKIPNHLVKDHGTCPDTVVTCKYCPFSFPTRDKLVQHCTVHFQQGMKISCDICPDAIIFNSQAQFRKHFFLVHKVGSVEFICEFCNKGYFEKKYYRSHVASHHHGEAAIASRISNDKVGKDQEVILSHSTSQSCDFCCQSVNFGNILEHVRGHVGDFALPCPNPACRHVYSNLTQYQKHIQSNQHCRPFMTKDIYSCELCGHKVKSVQGLRGHLQLVHETAEKSFSCPVTGCLNRFTHRLTVQTHIFQHTAKASRSKPEPALPPSFQACPTCKGHFPQDEIRGHLEKAHESPPDSIVSCNYCPYLFPSRDKLIDHFAVHLLMGIPISCDMCSDEQKFLHMRGLRNHYWIKHEVGRSRFLCEHCNKAFSAMANLRKHLKLNHSGSEKVALQRPRLKCDGCPDEEFKSERDLISHKIKFHGADPFKCQFCGKEFDNWQKLRKHENEHKGVLPEKNLFMCDIPGCGKGFKQKKGLKFHKMSVQHAGKTNSFMCGQCGKGFNHENTLKNHERFVHGTERKFVCEDCGESFKSGNVLKRHMMIHSGLRPFECHICQQKFRYREGLARHVEGHQEKGNNFKPNGPMKNNRKRINPK